MTCQQVFAALADPTRRLIFETLATAPRAVGELAATLPVSRPAVSQHLKVLSDAGLVSMRRDGVRNIYTVRKAELAVLRTWLEEVGDELPTADAPGGEEPAQPTVQAEPAPDHPPPAPAGAPAMMLPGEGRVPARQYGAATRPAVSPGKVE